MEYDIAVREAGSYRKSRGVTGADIRSAAAATLEHEQAARGTGVSIVLSDDAHLRELNRDFAHADSPTDVLSFPAGDDPPSLSDAAPYAGDVIISVERAATQAEAGGHALLAELQLLTVHGVLHLLGYDHGNASEKARMWRVQAVILASVGAELLGPGEESI